MATVKLLPSSAKAASTLCSVLLLYGLELVVALQLCLLKEGLSRKTPKCVDSYSAVNKSIQVIYTRRVLGKILHEVL